MMTTKKKKKKRKFLSDLTDPHAYAQRLMCGKMQNFTITVARLIHPSDCGFPSRMFMVLFVIFVSFFVVALALS